MSTSRHRLSLFLLSLLPIYYKIPTRACGENHFLSNIFLTTFKNYSIRFFAIWNHKSPLSLSLTLMIMIFRFIISIYYFQSGCKQTYPLALTTNALKNCHQISPMQFLFRPTLSSSFATTSSSSSIPIPPPPEFISTGKQRVVLAKEPHKYSPWRFPFLNRAPQWFRTYTHISIIGFAIIASLQDYHKKELEEERALKRATLPVAMYSRPTYKDEDNM